jgi:predicted ATPase/DNA-binding winged helix-turn-helix (wHTH) protein
MADVSGGVSNAPFRFGRFALSPASRQLLVDGQPANLGARAFDLLHALIERRERLVTKNELLDLVWPGLVVEENNLQVQVSALRKVLGPQVIATIPGRGYRFAAVLDDADSAPAGAPVAAHVTARAPAPAAPRTNLPVDLPRLYGREQDLASLRALIAAHRLVAIVGAGGIGKSRLAQAVAGATAGSFADGAWMVELAGLVEPELLPNTVAQVLEIKVAGSGAALDTLIVALAPRSLLLVLDNCEHLLEALAALVQGVLTGAPNVTVLATSQEPLRLPAEQQYRVLPLAVPAQASAPGAREFGAVALFEARVRAIDPRFALTEEDLPLAIDICRRLDGLPLAIEMAAARTATLGLRPVRDKLDARFKLLTGGARATLRRHQTLRAALEWSHNLLDDAERAVFRRLGVFAGGFTMELAQAVAGGDALDEWAVLDHLSALVEKSLVVAEAGDPPRYRLLESTRAYALEQLATGEMAETLQRHALAIRDLMARVDAANLDGELRTDQYAALVLPEQDNLRAAYAWATGDGGDPQVAIGLAAHTGSLIDYGVECGDWLVAQRSHVETDVAEPALAARYWRALAATNMTHRMPRAAQIGAALRAKTLYEALGQPRRVFSCLIQLARHRNAQGERLEARAALDEARLLLRTDWPPEFHIALVRVDGLIARDEGRFPEALARFRDAVRLSESSGDWRLEVIARLGLCDLLWQVAPIDETAREACALADELRARPAAGDEMAMHSANVIGILSEAGRVAEASTIAREALPHMRRSRQFYIEEWAHMFWRRGQHDTAALLLGASDAKRLRDGPPQVNEVRLIAELRAALAAELPGDVLERNCAAGAALAEAELPGLLAAALAQPWSEHA